MIVKSCEKKEKNSAELVAEVSAAEFDAAINEAYKKNKHRISVPGFRKGKAPRKIIEGMYGASIFYEDALDSLLPTVFAYAVTESKLRTVGYPALQDINVTDEKTVDVTFTIDLYPEITIGEYKGITAEKDAVEVTDKDVEDRIETVRYQNARIETVTGRPVIGGDTVTLDYAGTIDGVPFDGGTAENAELVIGSKQFIPGFEDQMQGMFTGEEKDINVTFPENYHAKELAGKDAVFHVKVVEIKEPVRPDLDDEFAKDVSEFDTLDEYRASVRTEITMEKQAAVDKKFEDAVLDKLIDMVDGDIPDSMVNVQIDNSLQNLESQLSMYGMNLESYAKMMGSDTAAMREQMRPGALKTVKGTLALEKVAELEKLEATDEQIEEEYNNLASSYGLDAESIKNQIAKEDIAREVQLREASKFVVANAVATEPAPKEETPAEESPTEEKPAEPAPAEESADAE